ncbi:MAG: hypothetical protein KDJ28_19325, partial [Candidatus Competibacteraceae bacterium]|nr:hypothetical protein [Candidatus Competibacteraceae bacterium]
CPEQRVRRLVGDSFRARKNLLGYVFRCPRVRATGAVGFQHGNGRNTHAEGMASVFRRKKRGYCSVEARFL